jgi:hypothetical protein
LIGRVAGAFARKLIFHTIIMFNGHKGLECSVCFAGVGLRAPDFHCVVE